MLNSKLLNFSKNVVDVWVLRWMIDHILDDPCGRPAAVENDTIIAGVEVVAVAVAVVVVRS